MNLCELLARQAAARPDAAAIIEGAPGHERTTTFAGLARRSARIAAALAAAGLRQGDAALVLVPMSAALYEAILALLRLGATAMIVDPSAGPRHVGRCCARARPRAFVAVPKAHLLRLAVPELRAVPENFTTRGWVPGAARLDPGAGAPEAPIVPVAADAPALLTFTSGSTGEPKAVVRSHGFLVEQHRVLARALEDRPGERDLATLPVFLLANLASGITSVIPHADLRRPGRIDPAPVIAQIARHRVERMAASPAFVERLVERCEAEGGALGGLKRVYVGGAPVFPGLVRRAQAVLPDGELVAVYGSTEAEPIAHVGARGIDADDYAAMLVGRGLLAGTPVPEIEARVIANRWGTPIGPFTRAAFDAERAKPQAPGEIVVTGPHVVRGYLDGRGDAEAKFEVDGVRWHRTGDLGYFDARGRLWLLGRCAGLVNDGRGALYPFAVECAALGVAGVRRAALAASGGRRLLLVEPRARGPAPDPEAVRERLAWAQLDRVALVGAIPMDARHNAKVDYAALERIVRRLSADVDRS
ncbi:MAG: AMP-binding protein [Burkholderiales bacterium]|nr:AMP-binding protein [Burkholderiales bacterium]